MKIASAISLLLFASVIHSVPVSAQDSSAQGVPFAAQHKVLGALTAFEVNGDTLTLHCADDVVVVQVVEPNIIRVHYRPGGRTSPATLVLDPDRTWSNDTPAFIDAHSDPMTVTGARIVVKISKNPVRMTFYDSAGNRLLQEPKGGGVYPRGLHFAYQATSPFFGIEGISLPGQNVDPRQDIRAPLWRTGGSVRAGRQGDGAAPLAYTTTYGLLVDSDGGNFDIPEGTLDFSGGSREDVEYFVIAGDPKTVMRGVADISGHPPMMPKWALGFMNSQYGTTEEEVTRIIDTYRAKQIPIDGFILDFDWKAWGEDDYGEWRWNSTYGAGNVNPDLYPNGASGQFARAMRDRGIKLAGIFKPRILLENTDGSPTIAAKYAADHDLFIPGQKPYDEYFSNRPARDIDFSKPLARTWFWDHMLPAYRAGIDYFWNDEADVNGEYFFPNFQHLNMARAMYDGARSASDQRVWSLSRNFYLGAQRYAYAEWSGDVVTGFDTMSWQAPRMLSIVALGEPHWSMDTGGFHGHPSPENYARWVEFSAFVPIMRVHGTWNEHRQPWVYGAQAEADAKAAIELRYRLIPYMYAYEHEAHETGLGIVRPLFWDFPEDTPNTPYITDEWMFGEAFLVAPIFAEGQAHRSIYLPRGEWIDYFRGQRYHGPMTLVYKVDPDTWADIPLFVRSGAIIPSQDVQPYVGERPVNRVYVDAFPAATETSFTYYDDDGSTYADEKGAFYQQRLSTIADGNSVRFDAAAPSGTLKPPLREYEVRLHEIGAGTVTINGAPAHRYGSLDELEHATGEGWAAATDVYGKVTFVKIASGAEKHVVATP